LTHQDIWRVSQDIRGHNKCSHNNKEVADETVAITGMGIGAVFWTLYKQEVSIRLAHHIKPSNVTIFPKDIVTTVPDVFHKLFDFGEALATQPLVPMEPIQDDKPRVPVFDDLTRYDEYRPQPTGVFGAGGEFFDSSELLNALVYLVLNPARRLIPDIASKIYECGVEEYIRVRLEQGFVPFARILENHQLRVMLEKFGLDGIDETVIWRVG